MSAGAGRWLRAGRVGRPHGLDGSFYVTEPKPELLEPGRSVTVRDRPAQIAQRKGTDLRPIIRLESPSDRAGVEELRGEPLLAAREEAPALSDNEWWTEDLEGCVVRSAGHAFGTVRRLIALPSCEALEVTRADGGPELLVPLVSDAVRSVDIERKQIEINLEFLDEEPS
jgi:16S rRNA processing protein RimM